MSKTIRQLLKSSKKIDRLDAELLIAHVLRKSREFVLVNPDYKIGRLKDWKIKRLVKKREKGIPLAYLTRHKEFFGLDFFVNKHVLVPRPETEILVGEVINYLKTKTYNLKPILIDVGTGSGCIPISISKNICKSGLSVIRNFYAIDISHKALRVAKKNVKKHDVQITFLRGNLLSPFINLKPSQPKTQNLIITANLPYITKEQFKAEPSIHHEPKLALVAEEQGLALYHELLKQISYLSKTYNLKPKTYFEIDPSQSSAIKPLIKKYLPKAKIEIKQDLAGLDRVVVIESN